MEGDVFSGVQQNVYWSSTSSDTPVDALFVDFEVGHIGLDNKNFSLTPYLVWPVRGGD